MKLLFAIKSLKHVAGGAERVFCTICSELISRGHDVTIVTFDLQDDISFYALDHRISLVNLAIGDSSKPAGFMESIVRMISLRRIVSDAKPDVTIGFMHSMFILLAFSLIGTGMAVVGSEHIVPAHYRRKRIQYFLLILSVQFLDKLTVLSNMIRSKYPLIVRRKMIVITNPVQKPIGKANIGLKKESYTLLSVGRLTEQKDHATLIRAFAQIVDECPKWQLKIIGEGVLASPLKHLVRSLGIEAKVTFHEFTRNIQSKYKTAEIFVIPSRYEAFGLVTVEAMSYGLPVIGFADCLGTNEIIEKYKTGILVEPGRNRVRSLAIALSKLMKDVKLRRHLGLGAFKAISSKYSTESVCDQWEDLLKSFGEAS
jgi:glycosyltransferase involved in cell wall biosynthesis